MTNYSYDSEISSIVSNYTNFLIQNDSIFFPSIHYSWDKIVWTYKFEFRYSNINDHLNYKIGFTVIDLLSENPIPVSHTYNISEMFDLQHLIDVYYESQYGYGLSIYDLTFAHDWVSFYLRFVITSIERTYFININVNDPSVYYAKEFNLSGSDRLSYLSFNSNHQTVVGNSYPNFSDLSVFNLVTGDQFLYDTKLSFDKQIFIDAFYGDKVLLSNYASELGRFKKYSFDLQTQELTLLNFSYFYYDFLHYIDKYFIGVKYRGILNYTQIYPPAHSSNSNFEPSSTNSTYYTINLSVIYFLIAFVPIALLHKRKRNRN